VLGGEAGDAGELDGLVEVERVAHPHVGGVDEADDVVEQLAHAEIGERRAEEHGADLAGGVGGGRVAVVATRSGPPTAPLKSSDQPILSCRRWRVVVVPAESACDGLAVAAEGDRRGGAGVGHRGRRGASEAPDEAGARQKEGVVEVGDRLVSESRLGAERNLGRDARRPADLVDVPVLRFGPPRCAT